MSSEKENYTSIVRLSFEILKGCFMDSAGEKIAQPEIISSNASNIGLFEKEFNVSTFLKAFSDKIHTNESLRKIPNIVSAADTTKLLYFVSRYDSSIKKRREEVSSLEVMTQLDLYSKIVHHDDTLLAVFNVLNWLEEIYQLPEIGARVVINLAATAKMQARLIADKKTSLDIDGIAMATDLDMNPREREELRNVMRAVYHLIRKGKLADAETRLEESSQVYHCPYYISLVAQSCGLNWWTTCAQFCLSR